MGTLELLIAKTLASPHKKLIYECVKITLLFLQDFYEHLRFFTIGLIRANVINILCILILGAPKKKQKSEVIVFIYLF